MSKHHISADGQTIVCTAGPYEDCRSRPLCDTEMWNFEGCVEHDGKHQGQSGQKCWQSENVNSGHLADSYQDTDEVDEVTLTPGAAVEVEWEGDCTLWRYEGEES